MGKFKRASLSGSEDVFRASQPGSLEGTEDVITEVIIESRRSDGSRRVPLTRDEIELLVDSIQASKYPSKARPPSLDRHERLDLLRAKLQAELD